ncbi:Telomerase Cajal body protein 1 [Borealophlyctis nickersoniae]|nr:Telomerase Cajal body protein 1 [Borealophlyctis nickersoniae]
MVEATATEDSLPDPAEDAAAFLTEEGELVEEEVAIVFHSNGAALPAQESGPAAELTEPPVPQASYYYLQYDFSVSPSLIRSTKRTFCTTASESRGREATRELEETNFFKGAKWSPDGTCLLSSSNDDVLRIFEVMVEATDQGCEESPLEPALSVREAEAVYDFCWYPLMSSTDPNTCCFLTSIRDHPVRMWDAYTGQLRCSYPAFDHMDQIWAPNCLSFNLDGSKIYCGFNDLIQIFDASRPGDAPLRRPTTPSRKSRKGQKGLLSTISFNPDHSGLYAAGSFGKNIGLYDERNDELLYLLKVADGGGVTQA